MSKHVKTKKDKVPKISEAEYAAYLSSLKTENPSTDKKTAEITPMECPKRNEN